jgi:hypothetical protein
MSKGLIYGLGRVTDVTVEIVKKAYQKETDRNGNPINFISAIGKSKNLRSYKKLVPVKDDTQTGGFKLNTDGSQVLVEVDATAEPRITLFADRRVDEDIFTRLKTAPEGSICEVSGELASKNFPDKKGDKEYDAFYGALHVTSLTVTPPTPKA